MPPKIEIPFRLLPSLDSFSSEDAYFEWEAREVARFEKTFWQAVDIYRVGLNFGGGFDHAKAFGLTD